MKLIGDQSVAGVTPASLLLLLSVITNHLRTWDEIFMFEISIKFWKNSENIKGRFENLTVVWNITVCYIHRPIYYTNQNNVAHYLPFCFAEVWKKHHMKLSYRTGTALMKMNENARILSAFENRLRAGFV